MNNTEVDEYTVRTKETGDKVYLIRDGKRHWVKNPTSLRALGFNLGDEVIIDYEKLIELEIGKPIDKKAPLKKDEPKKKKESKSGRKPILGYKKSATLEDFKNYNEQA